MSVRLFAMNRWSKLVPLLLIGMVRLGDIASAQQPSSGAELFEAARRGDTAVLQRLLLAGALPDPLDEAKRTPLLIAVEASQLEAAALLIEAGANINAQAANMDTPWMLAGALGRTEMLRQMIPKGPNFSLRNRFGGNALIPACERGHIETVKLLLTTKIDVNHINNLGWTCLLELVILGDGGPRYVEITQLVLAAGANPNTTDKDDVSPLAHAMRKGQREVAALIAGAGGR